MVGEPNEQQGIRIKSAFENKKTKAILMRKWADSIESKND